MKKVLILEDEVNIRSFVVINLKRAGYDAIEAGTGQEALDRLAENPDIGVAILDIMLPDIDGFQLCRQIRENWHPGHQQADRHHHAHGQDAGDG